MERRIRQAIEDGAFDDLPGAGKPLRIVDDGPGWWVRRTLAVERAARQQEAVMDEIERLLGRVWLVADEASVVATVAELNARAERAGWEAPLDTAEAVVTWRRMGRLRLGR